MSELTEKLKALPADEPLYWDDYGDDYYCNHQKLGFKTDDLKALAVSHEKLLAAAKDLSIVVKVFELRERAIKDGQHTSAQVLLNFMEAISEAEKI